MRHIRSVNGTGTDFRAKGGTRTPTGFPTTPSRSRCLTVSGAHPSFSLQPNPVQHAYRPPERLRLHVRVGLGRQPDVGVPCQLLYRERIFGLVTENPFAPGLRPAVTSCPILSLPVHLEEGLTD